MTHLAWMLLCLGTSTADTPQFSWAGAGDLRLLLRIDPQGHGARRGNQRPAEVIVDFTDSLASIAPGRIPDLASLQVIRQDPGTGEPIPSVKFAHARGEFDVPWRWYDDAIGYDFPEFSGNIDATNGKISFTRIPRFGYFYECVGDWKSGHLAFIHRETGQPAWYGLYFKLLPAGTAPETVEPRGFIGDGLNRCDPTGSSSTGLIHSRVDVFDWDNDGRLDLIVGCGRGGVVWYPNRGTATEPRFPFSRLLTTGDGKPVDVGWSATPRVVDWDGDDLPDLLCGGEWNRVVLYRNHGRKGAPSLEYAGLIRTDDEQPLALPFEPCPEPQPQFTYTRDYYPVLDTVDWDGDGDLDLLAGGYVTGRIFLYENIAGQKQDPRLRFSGAIEADDQPLDVEWAAAPTVADLDDDGDLDLITGSMPMTRGGGDSSSRDKFLRYYRNDGSRQQPRLHEIPMPRKGSFPRSSLGTPRLADWNADGILDLVVSSGTELYLYRNAGTTKEPMFEAHQNALRGTWGAAPLAANQMLDWNNDGLLDAVAAPTVLLNSGRGSPGIFDGAISVLSGGRVKSHLSGIGDDWYHPRLYDLDGDGLLDYMDADHPGHFWWHANRGTREKPLFEYEGIRLQLISGEPVHVGEGLEGFEALQGARPTYTVGDFNGDNLPDLVAADCLGMVRYFQQAPRPAADDPPRFEPPVELGKLAIRGEPYATDWNGDGKLDVLAGSSASDIVVFLGRGAGAQPLFEKAERLDIPPAPYGAGAPIVVADFDNDGDPDILLATAYGYSCFYEHSFIQSGYIRAKVVATEQRTP